MPSIRSLSQVVLSFAVQTAFGRLSSPFYRLAGNGTSSSASCPSPQLSCHNTTAVENLCCFNAPGGTLLQTQFWDTNPVSGPSNSWTIHGLWPDNCDGTYAANCDDTRAYTNISAILSSSGNGALLSYMNTYWTSNTGTAESFWEHEWGKHGTCISTLDPKCYTDYRPTEEVPDFFQKTVDLFKSLPTYELLSKAGITPSSSTTYTKTAILAALSAGHGGQNPYLGCTNSVELDEVWYFYNVRGSIQTGTFVPTSPVGASSTCPDTGIKYLPKGGSGGGSGSTTTTSPSSPTTTTTSPGSTPTGPAFSGKGYLNVITSGSQKGCLISYGTWFTSGTCATFTVTPTDSGFSLKSSKGYCAVDSGKFVCGSDVTADDATTFTASGSDLEYDGSTKFSAANVPGNSEQVTIQSGDGGGDVSLAVEWGAI